MFWEERGDEVFWGGAGGSSRRKCWALRGEGLREWGGGAGGKGSGEPDREGRILTGTIRENSPRM